MPKPKVPYAGDAALKRLLDRYCSPAPFHIPRMRFRGEIVSPSRQASSIKTIESLWPNGLPTFDNGSEERVFSSLDGIVEQRRPFRPARRR
jgi:hypothetical protein